MAGPAGGPGLEGPSARHHHCDDGRSEELAHEDGARPLPAPRSRRPRLAGGAGCRPSPRAAYDAPIRPAASHARFAHASEPSAESRRPSVRHPKASPRITAATRSMTGPRSGPRVRAQSGSCASRDSRSRGGGNRGGGCSVTIYADSGVPMGRIGSDAGDHGCSSRWSRRVFRLASARQTTVSAAP